MNRRKEKLIGEVEERLRRMKERNSNASPILSSHECSKIEESRNMKSQLKPRSYIRTCDSLSNEYVPNLTMTISGDCSLSTGNLYANCDTYTVEGSSAVPDSFDTVITSISLPRTTLYIPDSKAVQFEKLKKVRQPRGKAAKEGLENTDVSEMTANKSKMKQNKISKSSNISLRKQYMKNLGLM